MARSVSILNVASNCHAVSCPRKFCESVSVGRLFKVMIDVHDARSNGDRRIIGSVSDNKYSMGSSLSTRILTDTSGKNTENALLMSACSKVRYF